MTYTMLKAILETQPQIKTAKQLAIICNIYKNSIKEVKKALED